MNSRVWIIFCVASALHAQEPFFTKDKPATSTKPGQFQVTGGDEAPRGALALLSEEAKKEFFAVCGIADDWKIPVHVRLHGAAGDPVPARTMVKRMVDVDGTRTFLIDLHVGRGVDQPRFRRAVFELMIYELSLRNQRGPDVAPVVMPWLVDGLLEASDWKRGMSDRKPYRTLFEAGSFFRLSDLLATTEAEYEQFDGASRSAFRVSSGVLVMALLEQPDGRKHFQSLLSEIATFEGEPNVILSRHFPGLNFSQNGLEKLWSLQMANKGGLNTLTDVLGIRQTEDALNDALHLSFRNAEGLIERRPLAAWPALKDLKQEDRMAVIRPAEDALVRLSFRCFPSYRPVLAQYQSVLVKMTGKKSGEVEADLRQLDETRRVMNERAAKGRDYLDWFEITRARSTSGEFEDYMRLKQRLEENPYRRNTSTTRYLDRMDGLFHR